MAGDCKMVGDIDGDTLPDAVVGGMPGEGLVWYRWPDWRKTTIAIPNTEFTTDGRLGDVDGDGDLDVVLATVATQSRLYLNDGNGNLTDATSSLPQGSLSATDIELGDVDKDGDLDMVVGTMKQTTRL